MTEAPRRPSGASKRIAATLPLELSGFRREAALTDCTQLQGGSGAGVSVRYVHVEQPTRATIYIYDHGLHQPVDGDIRSTINRELQRAAATLVKSLKLQRYGAITCGPQITVPGRIGLRPMRGATFLVTAEDGSVTGEAVCVAINEGSFVKARVSDGSVGKAEAAGLWSVLLTNAVTEARS